MNILQDIFSWHIDIHIQEKCWLTFVPLIDLNNGNSITSFDKECRARSLQDWFSNSGKSSEPKPFPTFFSAILGVWAVSLLKIARWLLPFQALCSHTTGSEVFFFEFFFLSYGTFYPWRISLLPHCPALGQQPSPGHFLFLGMPKRLISFISNLWPLVDAGSDKKKGEGNGCWVVTKVSAPWLPYQGLSHDLPLGYCQ